MVFLGFGEPFGLPSRKTITSRLSRCNSFLPGSFFSDSQQAAVRIDSREKGLASKPQDDSSIRSDGSEGGNWTEGACGKGAPGGCAVPDWKYEKTGAHTPPCYEALEPQPAFPVSGSGAAAR